MRLWIYEIHIFELRNEEINVKKILAVIDATYAVAKRKPEKSGFPGFEPWPPRYRCSALTNWANKPTGSWLLNWFVIYPGKMKMKLWIYEIHMPIYMLTEQMSEKTKCPERDSNPRHPDLMEGSLTTELPRQPQWSESNICYKGNIDYQTFAPRPLGLGITSVGRRDACSSDQML